ncbi:MAG TPA: FMN-binding protein [Methylomirabilota bacterium]|nr:FMN-binding protein [Methylomirabilota bacterium]
MGGVAGGLLVLGVESGRAQEGVFLAVEESPRYLFPDASDVSDRSVVSTPYLQSRIRAIMGRPPTLWESAYRIFTAKRGERLLGFVAVVEEIGKHRPITFAVAVSPDATVHDIAVLAYREAYGGEVKERRFLRQYAGRKATAALLPYQDIQNIAGATLSVQATGRAVKKAVALLIATGDLH